VHMHAKFGYLILYGFLQLDTSSFCFLGISCKAILHKKKLSSLLPRSTHKDSNKIILHLSEVWSFSINFRILN
jgi:hypothetical protein